MSEPVDLQLFLEATSALESDYPIELGFVRPYLQELITARHVISKVPGVGRLLALADWLDMDDDLHGRVGDEVQQELRAVADALVAYNGVVA